ncbi:MAG TPA: AI-2E family transporter [Candidatus Onthomonas avicola]|nr:AI-2E family transporter [Candidatus Onthomonas avicola]
MKLEWKTCLRVGLTLFGVYLLIYYWDRLAGLAWLAFQVSGPLIFGCIAAYVLHIPMAFFERHLAFPNAPRLWQRLRRPVCLVLAFLSLLVLLFLIVQMILPELISCIRLLLERLPAALNQVAAELERNFQVSQFLSDEFDTYFTGRTDWESTIRQLADWLLTGLGGAVSSISALINSLVSTTVTLVVGLVFAIYLLMAKERLARQLCLLMDTYLSPVITEKVRSVLSTFDGCFHRFIVGQCMEAVILGVLCILGMTLFRFPYAGMVGTLVGFTALIPVVGAYIGAIVGALMIFTVSPLQALLFLIFLAILQQLEGNLIYPRVVGSSIGLPGIWVLAAVTVGGGILGISGMLLGVPVTAALYQLLRWDVHRHKSPRPATQPARTKEEDAV